MHKNQEFFKNNAFSVYLNIAIGLEVPDACSVFESRLTLLCLRAYMILTDAFVWVDFVTLSIRLLTPGVTLAERSSGVLTTITTYQAVAKVIFYRIKRNELKEFFSQWNDSHLGRPLNEHQEQILRDEMFYVKGISVFLLVTMAGPAIPWCLMPFIPLVQEARGGRFLAVPAWFPFDALATPVFEIVVVFQTFAAWFVIAKSVIFDSFFMSVMALLIMHLEHLKPSMEHLLLVDEVDIEEERETSGDVVIQRVLRGCDALPTSQDEGSHLPNMLVSILPDNPSETLTVTGKWTKLLTRSQRRERKNERNDKLILKVKDWTKYHQDVLMLGNQLHQLFSPVILIHFLTITLILCFAAFISVGVSLDIVQYTLSAAYGLGNIVQLFLLCHYGDRLAEASVSLSDAGLANGWQACSIKEVSSNLKIIFHRVQKPLQFFAFNVFSLSAETCLSIIRLAISYLMVLIEINSSNGKEKELLDPITENV